MTHTAILSIGHAARVGADLFDRAATAGLPTKLSLSASLGYDDNYRAIENVRVQFYGDDFSDVRAWSAWLGIEATEREGHEAGVTFCDAETVIDGVRVQLTANQRTER